MFSLKMITFCKNAACPPSPDLLAFQKEELEESEANCISRHLKTCDFCATEVEFYARHPQTEEKVPTVEMPIPLFELAEALLTDRHKHFSLLDRLVGSDNLTLKKV